MQETMHVRKIIAQIPHSGLLSPALCRYPCREYSQTKTVIKENFPPADCLIKWCQLVYNSAVRALSLLDNFPKELRALIATSN